MPAKSLIRVLLLREAIYRTLSPEERCVVALHQFDAALNTLLKEVSRGQFVVTSATNKVTSPPGAGER